MIHRWASDIMLHFSKSVPMKKQTCLHLERPEGDKILSKYIFLGWTISLICDFNFSLPGPTLSLKLCRYIHLGIWAKVCFQQLNQCTLPPLWPIRDRYRPWWIRPWITAPSWTSAIWNACESLTWCEWHTSAEQGEKLITNRCVCQPVGRVCLIQMWDGNVLGMLGN